MKNFNKFIPAIILIFICAGLYHLSKYELGDDDQVVITMFGKPVGGTRTVPGEYFKLPLVQEAHFFKKNIYLYEMVSVVSTADDKFLNLNTIVQWKITDAIQYMKKLNSHKLTNEFIADNITNSQLQVISNKTLKELIGSKLKLTEFSELEIDYSRTTEIENLAAEHFPGVGLELVTVKILATYPTNEYKVLTRK